MTLMMAIDNFGSFFYYSTYGVEIDYHFGTALIFKAAGAGGPSIVFTNVSSVRYEKFCYIKESA